MDIIILRREKFVENFYWDNSFFVSNFVSCLFVDNFFWKDL